MRYIRSLKCTCTIKIKIISRWSYKYFSIFTTILKIIIIKICSDKSSIFIKNCHPCSSLSCYSWVTLHRTVYGYWHFSSSNTYVIAKIIQLSSCSIINSSTGITTRLPSIDSTISSSIYYRSWASEITIWCSYFIIYTSILIEIIGSKW